jgi:hypothetical protein
MLVKLVKHCEVGWANIDMMQKIPNTGFCIIISINRVMTAVRRWKFESSRRFTIIQTVLYLVHLTVPIVSCFWIKELGTAMPYGCNDNIKGVDATKSTWWAFLILFQELNVAMVIKEFNILMLKSPLNQERNKILVMIYFLIYRNLLEFITFVQSYFH